MSAALIGNLIGAIIGVYIVSAIIYGLLVKRFVLGPKGWLASSGLGYVVAVVLSGFGNANGGPWSPGNGYWVYAFGAVVAGGIGYAQMKKRGKATVEPGAQI